MKISKNWRKMQPIYRYFAGEGENLDFSEEACREMYLWETYGEGNLKSGLFGSDRHNGYAVGKHWMDATVKMWNQDIKDGLLLPFELYTDAELKDWHWWLDRVVKNYNSNLISKAAISDWLGNEKKKTAA